MDLHENWTFKILVPRSSLLVADQSNTFALSQNRLTSLLFLIKMMEYLPARASQWQAGLILTSNEQRVTSNKQLNALLTYCFCPKK